ncbi:MAG: PD-(D/E)XK nuclease family protein [Bdellovibrionota bacterium]
MLEFTLVKHPDDIREKLSEFNPQTTTWVVSDLKSKQEIQQQCIDKYGFYSDEAILRVSDFWKMWMRRLSPSTQIVSSEFIRVLIGQFIELHGKANNIHSHEAKTLYKYVSDLAPLLLHPHSHEVLADWIEEKEIKPQWSKWIGIAQKCLDYIEQEHNCIESAWIVSYLQKLGLEKIVWPKKLIFDLGSQMTSLEMGLLNTLSRENHIEVVVPDPEWKNKFHYILNTYKDYSGFAKASTSQSVDASKKLSAQNFIRFNSEINEIKFITTKIRQWIEAGVEPEKILVLSPRIEDYWPILKFHLDAEGIHTQKDLVSSLISLGVIQRWLSIIHAQTRNVTWTKLEMSYASYIEQTHLQQFEKFKAAFIALLDDADLGRLVTVKDLFYQKINLDKKLKRDEFLVAMLQSWITVDQSLEHKKILQGIIKDFIQQTVDVQLRLSDWLTLLSSGLAKKEIKVEQTTKSGVQILPINSAQVLEATHRLWVGLDESGLKGKQTSLIPLSDIEELKKTFDLALDYPEESHADFNLRWYAMAGCQEQHFTCAHVSTTGEPLTTSLYFLENNKKPEAINYPATLVDIKQQQFNPSQHKDLEKKLGLEIKAEALKITNLKFKSLAPTDLESYDQCSFKFLARKGFRLQQFDQLGLEIDPRQKGTLVHDLFKFIVQDKNYLTIGEKELSKHLENERQTRNLFPFLDVFWGPHKEKLVSTGLKFIAAEKARLSAFTSVRHKTEETVQVYYDLVKYEFTQTQPTGAHFMIRGRLDRLDIDEKSQQGMVIDYKSSKSSDTSFAEKWVENSEFQLLIYSLAVEQIFGIKNVGAIYYFYKTLEQQYGYLLENDNVFKDHVKFTKKTLIEPGTQSEIYANFQAKMKDIFIHIEQNSYAVKPRTSKVCETCEWIDTCRVKNLK